MSEVFFLIAFLVTLSLWLSERRKRIHAEGRVKYFHLRCIDLTAKLKAKIKE